MHPPLPLTTVKELFKYNYWARDKQLAICAQLSTEQFCHPMRNSFSSMRDTLVHMMAVEWLWLKRWQGESPTSLFAPELFPGFIDVKERWQQIESEMMQYVNNLAEPALLEDVTYINMQGNTWSYALWRCMLHLLNHQSYHRGQVTTLLRQLGYEAVTVDFLFGHDQHFKS